MHSMWLQAAKGVGALGIGALLANSWVDGLPDGTGTTVFGLVALVLGIWTQRNQMAINGLNQLSQRQQAEIERGDEDRDRLHEENRILRRQVGSAKRRTLELELGVRRLVDQLERHDIEPAWRPPSQTHHQPPGATT